MKIGRKKRKRKKKERKTVHAGKKDEMKGKGRKEIKTVGRGI